MLLRVRVFQVAYQQPHINLRLRVH
jgi:hypothetical protein